MIFSKTNVGAFLLGIFVVSIGAARAVGEETVLTRIAQIRALSRSAAAEAHPVRIRGVVSWQRAEPLGSFIVDDGAFGIFVDMNSAKIRGVWKGEIFSPDESRLGSIVEIEGVTDPGGYAPQIVPSTLRWMGRGERPALRPYSLEELVSGSADSQPLELQGVVQSVSAMNARGKVSILLIVAGHPCRIDVEKGERVEARDLVDARVAVRGVLMPSSNLRSEVAGLKLGAMSVEDCTILERPLPDPFQAPHTALSCLLPFTPNPDRFHRKVTQGTVTFSEPGKFFFLQEGACGVRVDSPMKVVIGEQVEVAGFVDTSRQMAALTEAIVHPLGRAPFPDAVPLALQEALHPQLANPWQRAGVDFSGRLVKMRGQLRGVDTAEVEGSWVLNMESEGRAFSAFLPAHGDAWRSRPAWVNGAELDLTGVCELDFAPTLFTTGAPPVSGLRLWLRSAQDVEIRRVPSWWTPARLGFTLLALSLFCLLILAWNIALRRLLQKRKNVLEQAMRRHRDSELELRAATQERQRLAADLHDGLQQLIVSAAYRLESALVRLGAVPEAVQEQFEAARAALVRTQEGLRECLWGLRQVEEGPEDFAALLRHAVATVEHWPRGAVEVDSKGPIFSLSRHAMGSLLLLVQEAVSNAFKHGRARQVRIDLVYEMDRLDLQISDDGCGFEVENAVGISQGHFGLEAMALRMKWLGGSVKTTSQRGEGTSLLCRLPRHFVEGAPSTAATRDESQAASF